MARAPANAFTLVELLVVIAILGLLVSILLPSLGMATESARGASCLSNMRSMGLAMVLYTQDHDWRLPTVGMSHGSHQVDEQGSWFRLLEPYAGQDGLLYRCPSDRSSHWHTPPTPDGRLRKVSYGTNYYLSGQLPGYGSTVSPANVPEPSRTIYAGELTETGEYYAADHFHPELWLVNPEREPAKQLAVDRHLGRSNFLFVDGHAKGLTLEDVYELDPASKPRNVLWKHNMFDPKVAR